MQSTPISMRKHIVLTGKTNSGKSTLFNSLLGQEASIVSEIHGTTTDPVIKAMELIPYGPVALIDTAGTDDITALGLQRNKKTVSMLERADVILNVADASDRQTKSDLTAEISQPFLNVFTKCECIAESQLDALKKSYPDALFLSNYCRDGIDDLIKSLTALLKSTDNYHECTVADLLPPGSTVVLVTPIDSAAPKGRLILPQVQILRECLDGDITAYVTKDNTLQEAMDNIKNVDLVITDSQAFKSVDKIIPKSVKLTSFSMLSAMKKGDLNRYTDNAKYISHLKDGDRVLVFEGCTHNTTHEDIGKVKLPALIKKMTGAECTYEYYHGYDFPSDLCGYSLALSCGMCMINRQTVMSREEKLTAAGTPVVNYGVALAYLNGILERATEIFTR